MDRNFLGAKYCCFACVALRKESVDRNVAIATASAVAISSLSARRAWIEMIFLLSQLSLQRSLSARRAWIEMQKQSNHHKSIQSLSARRAWIEISRLDAEY